MSIQCNIDIEFEYDQELDNIDNVLTCDLRIENLYKAVVEFIKFYNDQNK